MDDPVEKALWYIETHFEGELGIDEIARVAGVSRFHLSRVFALTVGQPIMGYARARRLSQAAQALAGGAPDILSVALGHSYGSHEAFSRAFRDQFGVTPESVRAGGLANLKLMEPLRVKNEVQTDLAPPRFVDAPPLLVAGLSQRHRYGGDPAIPSQWQRFGPFIGAVPGQVGDVTYGIVTNVDDNDSFDYICAVEVRDFSDVPKELMTYRVPARRCAVFTHKGHVSSIPQTIRAIWRGWLPASGHKAAELPFIERYDERFDGRTGDGEVELWLPLQS